MTAIDHLKQLIDYQNKFVKSWVDEEKEVQSHSTTLAEDFDEFLADPEGNKMFVNISFDSYGFFCLQNYFYHHLHGGENAANYLGRAALYFYWYVRTDHASYLSKDPPKGGGLRFEGSYYHLGIVLSAGWEKEAERMGKDILEHIDKGIMTTFDDYLPAWLVLKAFRAWQGIEEEVEDELSVLHLEGYTALSRHWNDPDPALCKAALDEAADYRITQCGDSDDRDGGVVYMIDLSEYWLFPVELFSLLRMRQWLGLEMPVLDHPLFTMTPLGVLPDPVPLPEDSELARILDLFGKVVPNFKP